MTEHKASISRRGGLIVMSVEELEALMVSALADYRCGMAPHEIVDALGEILVEARALLNEPTIHVGSCATIREDLA